MDGALCLCIVILLVATTYAQMYKVDEINCGDFGQLQNSIEEGSELLSARLLKPPGFKGHPLFADDRTTNPLRDEICQIRPAIDDVSGVTYNLLVTDLNQCGIIKKDGYVQLRIWFPQLEGVVLATDQEVIIKCKPISPTIIENRAAGFALPSPARVSGIVEETPGKLEYEVALFRAVNARAGGQSLSPVDQAVPIGSWLQLRARINTDAIWKYAKLIEVTVSGDPRDPYLPGYVALVSDGCRPSDFASIVPQQPYRVREFPGEVRLDFEAFMLDTKLGGFSQLWIHATVKACIESLDCKPALCLDLRHPSGYGRRKRRRTTIYADGLIEILDDDSSFITVIPEPIDAEHWNDSDKKIREETEEFLDYGPSALKDSRQSAEIGNNLGLTVIMPDEFFTSTDALYQSCGTFIIISSFLGIILLLAFAFVCFLTSRLHKTVTHVQTSNLNTVIEEHNSKYGVRDFLKPPFQ